MAAMCLMGAPAEVTQELNRKGESWAKSTGHRTEVWQRGQTREQEPGEERRQRSEVSRKPQPDPLPKQSRSSCGVAAAQESPPYSL